ncbi:hypothetical protein LEMLEM_LOCUS26176, partial [Lemmus lemmus]
PEKHPGLQARPALNNFTIFVKQLCLALLQFSYGKSQDSPPGSLKQLAWGMPSCAGFSSPDRLECAAEETEAPGGSSFAPGWRLGSCGSQVHRWHLMSCLAPGLRLCRVLTSVSVFRLFCLLRL